MKNKKEIITEEGFPLKFYPSETRTTTLELSTDTLEMLEKVAKRKALPLKALLKFYVGQGLRNDLSHEEAAELALKRLKSGKGSRTSSEVDLVV